MAQLPYVYVDQGIALAQLQQVVPGAGSVAPASPIRLATITWDSMYKDDLDAAMLSFGWSYLYQGTAPTGVASRRSSQRRSPRTALRSGWAPGGATSPG